MAEAPWETIRELRMVGLAAADLRREAFADPAKQPTFGLWQCRIEWEKGGVKRLDRSSSRHQP